MGKWSYKLNWCGSVFSACLLLLGCNGNRPTTTEANHTTSPVSSPKNEGVPKPTAKEPPSEPPPAGPEQCVEVDIGLDLRALPHPVSEGHIRMYTRGQAQDFRELAPADVRIEIYVIDGVAAFAAKLYASEEVDLMATCTSMAEKFVPTVPGHPLSRSSGGSITTPCHVCSPEIMTSTP
jgi:hypothetical protein